MLDPAQPGCGRAECPGRQRLGRGRAVFFGGWESTGIHL
jgi:hypothetical protein